MSRRTRAELTDVPAEAGEGRPTLPRKPGGLAEPRSWMADGPAVGPSDKKSL